MGKLARRLAPVLAAASTALLLACGEVSDEERLQEAAVRVADARQAVEEARATVDSRQEILDGAEAALAEAQETLRNVETLLREAESQVDLTATDAVLFRSVQQRLLAEEDLEDVAIRAQVENGIVTLHGSVPLERLRELAVEVSRSVAGVTAVRTEILVPAAPTEE